MEKKFIVIIFLFLNITSQITAQQIFLTGDLCPSTPAWKLAFSEEFNGNSLDLNKWFTYYPYCPVADQCDGARLHTLNENQVYKDENILVSNGTLKLIIKKETATWYGHTRPHTSAMIQSKTNFKEGKFEIRAKFPAGKGFWPALWMWGLDEIDIAEFNGKDKNIMYHVCHYAPCTENCNTLSSSNLFDYTQDFHIYSVEWTPYLLVWKVDGTEVKRMGKYITMSGTELTACSVIPGIYTLNPKFPNEYLNIIANFASPGNDCSENSIFSCYPDENTIFPNQFEIDYIRVYHRDLHDGFSDLCANSNINGNAIICNANNYTYQLESLNVNPIWSVSSNLQIISSNSTNITVKRLVANGSAWIKAQFSSTEPCPAIITKNISIGGTSVPNFSIVENIEPCIPSTHPYGRYSTSPSTSVMWSASSGTTCLNCATGSTAIVRPNSVGGFTLTASKNYTTGCGTTGTTTISRSFYASPCSNGDLQRVAVSPNPTSGNVRFNLENIQLLDINRIEVRDLMNQLVQTITPYSTNIDTDFSDLNNGIYYVVVQLNTGQLITNSFTLNK